MKNIVRVIFISFCLYYIDASIARTSISQDDEGELVSVAVLFRHGDAAPSKASSSFPNDPYIDASYWPMGYGQLTNKGKNHMYDLGLWLRDRYSNFLPEDYFVNDIYVRSTDLDVTLMSAEIVLAALYPPTGSQLWNENIPWQPIAVHTIPLEDDQILYMGSDCPKFYQYYDEIYSNGYFSAINGENADLYRQVSELTGWNVTDFSTIAKLYAILNIYANYDVSFLPPWTDTLDQEQLAYLAALDYVRYTSTDGLKRLGAGPFFSNLFSHLDKAVNNPTNAPKLFTLVGHESTLVATLNTMGLFEDRIAQFGSIMIWELRKTSAGEHVVTLFYRNERNHELKELLVKTYDDYRTSLLPFTVDMDSWHQECVI